MGKLLAISSDDYRTPVDGLKSLSAMSEEFDSNSVTGILLRDLGGPFKTLKKYPVLSGVFTREGIRKLDIFMLEMGFMTKYKVSFKITNNKNGDIPQRDVYLIRVYDFPYNWDNITSTEAESKLMDICLELKRMSEEKNDMTVFSFWPDVILMKEIISPLEIIEHLELDRVEFSAKLMMLYVNESNGFDKNLYSFNPSFLQGYASMNNGENNSYIKNRDFLSSRKSYNYCSSRSETLTQILHYYISALELEIKNIKHVISPLTGKELKEHQDSNFLTMLKHSCRSMSIDGAQCLIGSLPDNTLFLTKDAKSITTCVVGTKPGITAFSSEITGLEKLLPDRDKTQDYQPAHDELIVLNPTNPEMEIHSQQNRI
ncbi:MAG: glutamate synthase [Desulfobacterales bacterium]|nr:glutamate synthase [Desulfobacterales bacterium]